MRIAACDDDLRELSELSVLLDTYCSTNAKDVSFETYSNPTDLLCVMKNKDYDILLLDVLMPGLNGIEAAREIRQYNEKVEIIFLTTSPEYAVDSYHVRAYYYLLKPVSSTTLFPLLDQLSERFTKQVELLHLKTHQSIFSIAYNKIEFVEIIGRTLYFHLTDGTLREVNAPLSEYEPTLLTRPEFIKCHRSYLVNLQHILELEINEFITVSGSRIPIARNHYKNVRETYVRHLFSDAEVK